MQRRLVLAGALAALLPTSSRAADAVGIWTLDREAWDAFVAGLAPKILAKIPKAQREAMEARGVDVAAEIRAGLSQGIEGSVELRPNGRVIAQNRHGDPDGTGLWRNDGELIEIDLPKENLRLEGTWRGDRMELKPVLDPDILAGKGTDPLWTEAVRQMTFVLVRKG